MMLSWVWVAEWPPSGRELLHRFTMYSLRVLTFRNFCYFPLWVLGGALVLVAAVPGHCLPFTFSVTIFLWQ